MTKPWLPIGLLLATLVLFVAINIVGATVMRSARIDLTEGRLFTLSEGSRNIARSPGEPVRLMLYYTDRQAGDLPGFKAYATRVKEVLAEYVNASGGKITLQTVNPEPFSEAEDRAVQAGLYGVPTGRAEDRFFFGLVGTNSVDRHEVIAFFDPTKEDFLEYDLSRLIYRLSDQPRKTVGLMTWLPIDGMPGNPLSGARGIPQWQIDAVLQDLFDIKPIPTNASVIPPGINLLIVIHPKTMSPETQYAIDQFVLRGGKLIAFVDPFCESDTPPGMNPMQAMGLPRSSDLPTLFAAWGVQMEPGKIAGDRTNAIRVSMGTQTRPEAVDYIAWMSLQRDGLNSTDPITGQLRSILVATSGILRQTDSSLTGGGGITFTPLITTSTASMALDAALVSVIPDPRRLLAEFTPGGIPLTLAARITGKVKSAFPGGPPSPTTQPDSPTDAAPTPPAPGPHIAESAAPVDIVIVADCDMLADRFWVQEDRLGKVSLGFRKVADNGDFVVAAADNLTGSTDLMSLRARGSFARPFGRVRDLQAAARQAYAAKEEELQQRLRDTEAKIGEIQRQRPDGASAAILTPEQSAEIEKFRLQMVDTRKELRDVQHQLRSDIEQLGTRIKIINIALVPALLAVGAILLAGFRAARRRADRRSASAD